MVRETGPGPRTGTGGRLAWVAQGPGSRTRGRRAAVFRGCLPSGGHAQVRHGPHPRLPCGSNMPHVATRQAPPGPRLGHHPTHPHPMPPTLVMPRTCPPPSPPPSRLACDPARSTGPARPKPGPPPLCSTAPPPPQPRRWRWRWQRQGGDGGQVDVAGIACGGLACTWVTAHGSVTGRTNHGTQSLASPRLRRMRHHHGGHVGHDPHIRDACNMPGGRGAGQEAPPLLTPHSPPPPA